MEQKSFFERYRSLLVGAVVVAVAAVVIGLVVTQTTAAAYTCSIIFDPAPTASPAAGSSPRLGYQQDLMPSTHDVSRPQNYTYCPPASGKHNNVTGLGPIVPRVFRPDDSVGPTNWVHNLEHGAPRRPLSRRQSGGHGRRLGGIPDLLRHLPAQSDLQGAGRPGCRRSLPGSTR